MQKIYYLLFPVLQISLGNMQSRLYCSWRCFIFLVGSLVFFLWFSNFDLLDDSAELEAVLDGSQEAGGREILVNHIKTVLASPSGRKQGYPQI